MLNDVVSGAVTGRGITRPGRLHVRRQATTWREGVIIRAEHDASAHGHPSAKPRRDGRAGACTRRAAAQMEDSMSALAMGSEFVTGRPGVIHSMEMDTTISRRSATTPWTSRDAGSRIIEAGIVTKRQMGRGLQTQTARPARTASKPGDGRLSRSGCQRGLRARAACVATTCRLSRRRLRADHRPVPERLARVRKPVWIKVRAHTASCTTRAW